MEAPYILETRKHLPQEKLKHKLKNMPHFGGAFFCYKIA
jgi:hypothetical protein